MKSWHDPDPVYLDCSLPFICSVDRALSLAEKWSGHLDRRSEELSSTRFILDMIELATHAACLNIPSRIVTVEAPTDQTIPGMIDPMFPIPPRWRYLLAFGTGLDRLRNYNEARGILRRACYYIIRHQDDFDRVTGLDFRIEAGVICRTLLAMNDYATKKIGAV